MHRLARESLMKDRVLLLGTSNRKKVIELEAHLGPRGFTLRTPADFPDAIEVEETGATFIENASANLGVLLLGRLRQPPRLQPIG